MLFEQSTIDIMELFHNYVDINELPYHKSWDDVIGYIREHPGHLIVYYTPYGWLFDLFHRYVLGLIDIEDMMNSGDIIKPVISEQHHEGDCYVIDDVYVNLIVNKENNIIYIK